MFKTIKRMIDWCGDFKGKLYLGFVFSFFSTWFAAAPTMFAAYSIGLFIECERKGEVFDKTWIWKALLIIMVLVFFRFLFDYFKAKCQESISYELVARDRLAIGDALKRVSLGYFQKMNSGNILSAITTGLYSLENMGMRMLDNFVGGYLNFFCILMCLLFVSPKISLIAVGAAILSFLFLLIVSRCSAKNAPLAAKAGQDLTSATVEYTRGLSVVKSFGQSGASVKAMKDACRDNRDICLKIEWGFIPSNCLHLVALKIGSVALAGAACYMGITGEFSLPTMLIFTFLSFGIFASLEPISDSAHVLSVIDNAMNQLEELQESNYIDLEGRDISLSSYEIEFSHVDFGYDERKILKDVNFRIPENTTTAIVGPSGSGKTTICNLLARFYDVNEGSITVGGHDVREFTCDSLLSNIAMVFQNVYLFHDTIRANICFGKQDATEEEMIEVAKKACCHEFIMALPNGYDTVIGEGGGTLSGGEKQRISIARAMLKDAPIIILDEATASVDPENEHLIQAAISELTRGKTIITIAHRLATIEHADQILVIEEGRLVQKGTHNELVKEDGIYKKFIEIRKQAETWMLE